MIDACLLKKVVSIICEDTEVDNEESDCCSEDLISEEVISASASKRPRKLDPAVPTLSKRAIILLSVLRRAPCPVETLPIFTLHPFSEHSLSSESNDSDSSLEQLLCEKTSHTTSSFWKKGSLS